MIDHWNEFLEEHGPAAVTASGHSHVPAENTDAFQKLAGDIICDLNHTSLVRVRGDDAEDFLQNQLSNDIQSLDVGRTVLAGYCNAKGRLICIFRVWRDADGYLLQVAAEMHDTAIGRLRKYVLRAKAEFSLDQDLVEFGVCGKTVAGGLEKIFGRLPRAENELARGGGLSVMRIPGAGRPRFQLAGSVEACKAAWKELERHATVTGSWAWSCLDILAGVPNITSRTSESFVPQMVNLDLIGGVNFKKGCYPGQEIVARMHYLGNLKQRMARFRLDDQTRPEPGDRVYTQGTTSPTGTIVDAQPGAGAGWELLAVVRIADLGRGSLRVKNKSGPALFQQDLPYSLPGPE